MRLHYERNREHRDQYCRKWRNTTRQELLLQYGGKCNHCGIDNLDVLDFDHVNDDGNQDRKKNIIFFVQQDPKRFQVLCKNCNWLKELKRRHHAK